MPFPFAREKYIYLYEERLVMVTDSAESRVQIPHSFFLREIYIWYYERSMMVAMKMYVGSIPTLS